jgi:hypothetical protein
MHAWHLKPHREIISIIERILQPFMTSFYRDHTQEEAAVGSLTQAIALEIFLDGSFRAF